MCEGNKCLAESVKYKAVGALGMELGLAWGDNWKTIVDQPHFQLRPDWAAGMSERELLPSCVPAPPTIGNCLHDHDTNP